jgi:4-amino-4-deoxy-L-arabinose transferase-like glycosyltransferase
LAVGLLTAAFLATRLALTWRFPWFVDETIFASFAKEVHGNIGNLFIAEIDKKGLLPSWLGAALIGLGIDPITAMRLLACAGAAAAAAFGGLLMRRLHGLREGILTAALIAVGPFFLVTASVGVYDAMTTGLVAAAVLVSLRLMQRPRPYTALLLGAVLGAGALTKPTAWVAAFVLPFTLLLFDRRAPLARRRFLIWLGHALLALAVGYGLACIARLTPLYDIPMKQPNQRAPSQAIGDLLPALRANWRPLWDGLLGYLTLPGLLLAVLGAVAGWRRRREATAILGVWTGAVLVSALLLPLTEYPRYFATAVVPLSGLAAIGGLAGWDAIVGGSWASLPVRRSAAVAAALVAVLPAALFGARVLADPAHASYPGLDQVQYVTATSAQVWVDPVAREIERRGGPYPVHVDMGSAYPWGLELRLNGDAVGAVRRYDVFQNGRPAQRARARWFVSDGSDGTTRPPRGFRLVRRMARSDGGAVMRLYERI